jgi:hypothetical protein
LINLYALNFDTMEDVGIQLDCYVLVNDRQKQLVGKLKNILPEQAPEAEAERAVRADTIRDTLPPDLLYQSQVLAGQTTLSHVTRGALILLSRPFNQVLISDIPGRVSLGLTRQMYEDKDAELALAMAESFFRTT